jgi:hypothetical protein
MSSSDKMALDDDDDDANEPGDNYCCVVCRQLFVQPVTTPCGHTFCRPCLVQCLSLSKRQCPVCRAECRLDAQSAAVSVVLQTLVRTAYPALYQQRLEWANAEKEKWDAQLMLFRLGSQQVRSANPCD